MRFIAAASVLTLAACGPDGGLGQDRLTSEWPTWQLIVTTELPETWRFEEASPAFDAWEAEVVVQAIETAETTTVFSFADHEGTTLDVRTAAVPGGALAPSVSVGDSLIARLVEWQGFEGVARALFLLTSDYDLLFLYDDGGYGPGVQSAESRFDVEIVRALTGSRTGASWERRDVTFARGADSVVLAEGETDRIGDSELAGSVVVSREWTGEPPTDVDLTPLAYLLFRTR